MTDNVNSIGIMDDDEVEDPGSNSNSPDPLIGEQPSPLQRVTGSKADQQARADASRAAMADMQSQYSTASQRQADAYAEEKAQIDAATKRLMDMQVGPSDRETQLRTASAILSHRGNGVGTGEMYGAQADALQQQREAEMQKNQLLAQYAQAGPQATIGQTNAQMNSLIQRMRLQQSDINNSANAANKNQLLDKYYTVDPNDPTKLIDHPEMRAADEAQKATEAAAAAKAKLAAQASMTGMVTPEAVEITYQTGKAPAGYSRNPVVNAQLWQAVHQRAQQEGNDPAAFFANTQMTGAQAAVVKDFESGATSKSLDGLNTAIKHIQILRPLISQLNNTGTPAFNQVANTVSAQLGLSGSGAINNFDAARDFVAGEISKAVLPGGGGEAERQQIAKAVQNAKKPEDLQSAIDQWQQMLAGKTDALRQRWTAAGLEQKSPFNNKLLPETKAALGIKDPTLPARPGQQQGTPYQQQLAQWYMNGKQGPAPTPPAQ